MPKKYKTQGNHSAQPQSGPDAIEVTFTFDSGDAQEIHLCGDFNRWSPGTVRMIRLNGNGHWERRLVLPPGRYEYKFLVDGEWTPDPQGRECVRNAIGSTNSVVVVSR